MISKTVRRMLAVSLAAVMAVGAMAGCGTKDDQGTPDPTKAPEKQDEQPSAGGDTTTPDPTTAPVEEEPDVLPEYVVRKDANGNVYDLGGVEIVIRDWFATGERTRNNAADEARWDYVEWAEETYNFTVREEAIGDWGSNPQDFIDYATTGGDEYYLFTLRQCAEVAQAFQSGLMYDLSTLDCLDFTQDKWKSGVHNLMGKDGAYYGMRGIDPEPRGCLYFNKRLLTEAGIDPNEIYELQRNGQWTWAKFEEMCAKVQRDTNADSIIDVWAMTGQDTEMYKSAVTTNGGAFIDRDADGNYYSDLESAETLEALNWMLEMRGKYNFPQPEGANWDYFIAGFTDANAVFFVDQAYRGSQIFGSMADEYGCVVFPKGPSADKYISFYEDNVYVIPSCYDEDKAWKIAFVYDLYTTPISGNDDGWKSGYYQNFHDIESVDETMQILYDNGTLLHHAMVYGVDLANHLLWKLGGTDAETGEVNTPAALAEKLRETWKAYLEDANK